MNRAKLIFNQTLMVSTAILFGMGVRTAVLFVTTGEYPIKGIPAPAVPTGFKDPAMIGSEDKQ